MQAKYGVSEKVEDQNIPFLVRSLSVVVAIGSFCILAWLLYYSQYGFDFTDESFHIVSMHNPFIYPTSTSQFGFMYHPIFEMLSGDIAATRQFNVIFTFILAWVLVDIFIRKIFPCASIGKLNRISVSSGFATLSLVIFDAWLVTPNYNSLTFQALLISAIGLLLAERKVTRSSVLGWIIIGLGGWLAFMAKPSSAAALAVCVATYLLLSGRMNFKLLLVAIGGAVLPLVLSALTIDGSIVAFVGRIKHGVELSAYLGAGHTLSGIFRIDSFYLLHTEIMFLTGAVIFVFLSARLLQDNKTSANLFGLVLVSLVSIGIVGVTLGLFGRPIKFGRFQGLLVWAVPISALVIGFVHFRFVEVIKEVTLSSWVLAAVFFIFPHAYAFGTNNDYWSHGSSAGLFWVLAGLALFSPTVCTSRAWVSLFSLAIASQAIVVALLFTAIETPRRQTQPLRLNDYSMEIGRPGSSLLLSQGYGQYITRAIEGATKAGFIKGTPIIDLSGQSPGILYALGARSSGKPWLIGKYPGSDRLAQELLKITGCDELSLAWLLIEPSGPRSISSDVLAIFGANLGSHYELVATWDTAVGAGGYEKSRVQQLFAPKRVQSEAVEACIKRKGEP